jgi:hypothetical protein
MKKSILFLAFFGVALLFAQTVTNLTEFKANIKSNKEEAKNALDSYLYDGYKTTYFNYKTYEQTKEVEIYLFNNTEYKLSFNGKSCTKDVKIKIYNNDKSSEDRVLLKEVSNVSGKNIIIQTDELNDTFKNANKEATRLKRVFVTYEIPATSGANNSSPNIEDRGAIVLVMGYKN